MSFEEQLQGEWKILFDITNFTGIVLDYKGKHRKVP